MADVVLGEPDEGSYSYVMVHHGLPKVHKILISAYDESTWTRLVEWPSTWEIPGGPNARNAPRQPGDLATFAFISSRHLKSRLEKEGWEDVTRAWRDHKAGKIGTDTKGDPTRLGRQVGPTGRAASSPARSRRVQSPPTVQTAAPEPKAETETADPPKVDEATPLRRRRVK